MKLTDIIKGMLAPVVSVESDAEKTHVRTKWFNAVVYDGGLTAPIYGIDRNVIGFTTGVAPFAVPTDAKFHDARIGNIGFAFWREPRKLRRVA